MNTAVHDQVRNTFKRGTYTMKSLLDSLDRGTPRLGLRSILAAARARAADNRDMTHLTKLDDRLLRDIGITSFDLDPWR
jgi:uncharacterized protein YjiS (DUF1127 family)